MEKTILTEFLRMYKSFPCLWNQKHMLYGNREARDKAYEALLEKYKLVQDNATLVEVKKKIEYMRCAYRREHKKVLGLTCQSVTKCMESMEFDTNRQFCDDLLTVLIAHFRGTEYKPHLWYFDLLSFLNDHEQGEFKLNDSMATSFEDSYYQETHEIEDSDEDTSKPKRRKKMTNNNSNNHSSNPIYMTEEHHNEDDDVAIQEDIIYEQDQTQSYIVSNEADAFGRTVGYQLKELKHMQRIYAEKLISDVIFNARLCNLNAETTLSFD